MTRREHLQEHYEDALFALLMDEVATAEGKKALEENERLQNDPDAEVPEEIDKSCMRAIHRHFAKQRARTAGRVTAKVFGRMAMVAGVAAMLFTAAFATSETVRVNTMNLVVQVFGESTDFYFANNQTAGIIPQVTVGWLPEGYTLEDQGRSDMSLWYHYQGPENNSIRIGYTLSDGTVLSVDTEDAKTESININGMQAMLVTKGNERQIVWGTADSTAFISLIGIGLETADLIHVANELEY